MNLHPEPALWAKKYIRLQVEIDLRKPIPSGFMHKLASKTSWIQFRYERLAEYCYSCGIMGHSKAGCSIGKVLNDSHGDDIYGPWLRAEPYAYTVVREPFGLRKVELPRDEIFDSFSHETNANTRDGKKN